MGSFRARAQGIRGGDVEFHGDSSIVLVLVLLAVRADMLNDVFLTYVLSVLLCRTMDGLVALDFATDVPVTRSYAMLCQINSFYNAEVFKCEPNHRPDTGGRCACGRLIWYLGTLGRV